MVSRFIFLASLLVVAAGVASPFVTTIDTCNLSSPCISGTNSGVGAGVAGISLNGRGVSGQTKHNSTSAANAMYGVYGLDLSTSGVYNGGVYGKSQRGYGVYGTSGGGVGVYGISGSASGVEGVANTVGAFGAALFGYNGNVGGYGADVTGGHIALIARSDGYPLDLVDLSGNQLVYVDHFGNLGYHGNLVQFLRAPSGGSITAFGSSATRPSIEDTGTARLIYGQATIRLDPVFARAIDTRRPYQVFLTPGGDTRGLYVAAKGRSAFVVREVQGGHGTFDFDYHIYATQFGATAAHMLMGPPSIAPLVRPQ
jgi:hypothetical protein